MSNCKTNIIALIVLCFALDLPYLKTVPRVYYDDVWESSVGHSLAFEGRLRCEWIEGFGGMNIHFIQPRLVQAFVSAGIFKLAGFNMFTARIGSVFFSILTIVGLYALTRRWFDDKQAFLISAVTILHPWFFEISRRARPEIYCLAMAIFFLWCIVYAFDTSSKISAFLAGIFATLAILAHPTGFALDAAIGIAVLIWLNTKSTWRLIPWVCLGGIVAALPYIIYVLWAIQNPAVSFAEQIKSSNFHRNILSFEIDRWESFFQWPKGAPLAALIIASWLTAWYKSTRYDKTIATIIGLFVLIIPFTAINSAARYLAVIVPFISALILRLVWRIISDKSFPLQNQYKLRRLAAVSIAFMYVLLSIVAVSMMFYYLHNADFDKVISRITSVVNKDDRILGNLMLWMGHDRYDFCPIYFNYNMTDTTDEQIKIARLHNVNYTVRTCWGLNASYGIASPPDKMSEFIPGNPFDQICKRFGKKVCEFRDPYFGPFEIYKIDWGNN
jgi:hypothetical protein